MFHTPAWLAAALVILPGAWGLLRWAQARRDRVADALGKSATLLRAGVEPARRSPAVRVVAIGFLLLALAGPRFGVELVETRSDSRQAVIAVDVSMSMLTPDVKPTRLERAKASLSLLNGGTGVLRTDLSQIDLSGTTLLSTLNQGGGVQRVNATGAAGLAAERGLHGCVQ